MKIKKAILPVAGLGTRFLPATKAQPKEMLPVFDTPVIEFIVREAVEAGIEDIIIITGREKRALENHFDSNFELEFALEGRGKTEALKMVRSITHLANFVYVRQPEPLGDGHAILCAKDLIGENESVVVLFGDDLVDNEGGRNAVQQLIDVYEATGKPVAFLEKIDRSQTKKYGIAKLNDSNSIEAFVEKPDPKDAPSDLGVVGKYVITPAILQILAQTSPGQDGELRLADAFTAYINRGGDLKGKVLEGTRFDTGDKLGLLRATIHYALKKDEKAVKEVLKGFY